MNVSPIEIYKFCGQAEGKNLLVLGSVHGNEVCGSIAIRKILNDLFEGTLQIQRGSVTLIPVCNPKAFSLKQRRGDRDLNRNFAPVENPTFFEDCVANIICQVMEKCDVLLDLHSFRAQGAPFLFVGPESNTGDLEPFDKANEELQFAMSLGVRRMVYGWLPTYHKFVVDQQEILAHCPSESSQRAELALTKFGMGTTEYFRSLGKYGVTLECGNHEDPQSVEVALTAIHSALSHLGICSTHTAPFVPFKESFCFTRIIIRENEHDRLEKEWGAFSLVHKDELLGRRADGCEVRAPENGVIIFCYSDARVGGEWIYFASLSERGKHL